MHSLFAADDDDDDDRGGNYYYYSGNNNNNSAGAGAGAGGRIRDCAAATELVGVLGQLARYTPHQQTQSLALAVLHRIQTYHSLQVLADVLMNNRRWTTELEELEQ